MKSYFYICTSMSFLPTFYSHSTSYYHKYLTPTIFSQSHFSSFSTPIAFFHHVITLFPNAYSLYSHAYVDKLFVTAVLDSLNKSLRSMSPYLMASDLSILHNRKTRTGKCIINRHHAFL